MTSYALRPATVDDVPAIVGLIGELAAFERLEHLVEVTPQRLAQHLFGARPAAEAWVATLVRPDGGADAATGTAVADAATGTVVADAATGPAVADAATATAVADAATATVVAFALAFTNFSTFLGRPGPYLEDLYVQPAHRGAGIGRALLVRLAQLAVERGCGRFEWSVLDWNAGAIAFYERMGATVLPDWRICRVTGDAWVALGERSR